MKNTASNVNDPDYDDDLENEAPESGVSRISDAERSDRFAENQVEQDRQKREDQADEDKIRKREQIMAIVQQEILMSGITLGMQEMKDLFDAIVALVETMTPKAGRHITAFLQRLGEHTQKTSKLRDEGFGGQATVDTVKFLEDELTIISKIPDRHIRDQVTMLLGFAINPDKLEQEIEGVKNKTLGWTIASFAPGGGLIGLYEAKEGRTMAGEKVSGAGRVAKATFGAVTVAADLATYGVFSAAKGVVTKIVGASSTLQKGAKLLETTTAVKALKATLESIKTVKVAAAAGGVRTLDKVVTLLDGSPRLAKGVIDATYLVQTRPEIIKYGVKGAQLAKVNVDNALRSASFEDSNEEINHSTGKAGAKLTIDRIIKNPQAANDTDERLAA